MKTWMEQGSVGAVPGMWGIVIALIVTTALLGKRYS